MDGAVKKAEGRKPRAERRPKPQDRIGARTSRRVFSKDHEEADALHAKPPPISAVTFDVGGTLIECWPSVGHIYSDVAAQHGYVVSPSLLNRNFNTAWKAFQGFHHTRSQWAELVDATFCGLIEPPPSRIFFAELYKRFAEPDVWHVYEDVLPTLAALKSRRLKLGVISNWDERLRPLLQRLELSGYFDTIVVSCEAGACKPAREVFVTACAALGSAPENTLHIGDSLEMDLRGAQTAGLQARRIRRGARRLLAGELGSLREIDKL